MDIDYALPGQLVVSVFEILLVDAGYDVIPTGIERTIRQLRTVDVDTYKDLIDRRFRSFPDFFVLDVKARQSWLAEVKFRHYVHPRLFDDLRIMQRDWAPFALILNLLDPPKEWSGTVRHIRVFKIEPDTKLDLEFLTHAGLKLEDVFARLGEKWREGTMQKAQDAILRILS